MNDQYTSRIAQRIVQAVRSAPLQFDQIVRQCEGAYPAVVAEVLRTLESDIVMETGKTYSLQPEVHTSPPPKSRLSEIEGNPILSSWYFTTGSCRRMEQLWDWSEARIAFLGTPRLYEWFASRGIGKARCLIELDPLVVASLQDLDPNQTEIVQRDIHAHIPESLLGEFNFVIFDPPWYPGEYEIWIQRAMRLAPAGMLCFSLFPELTRPDAPAERARVLAYLKERASLVICISGCLEYDVPSFEKQQLIASGIVGLGSWKLSDLIFCRVNRTATEEGVAECAPTFENWVEIDIGQLRIFVKVVGSAGVHVSFLRSAAENSIVLPSPSHRDESHNEANVLTSRGHGLICSDPRKLVHILQSAQLTQARNGRWTQEIERLAIDLPSKQLLKSLLL
jgi:hypothetical protein